VSLPNTITFARLLGCIVFAALFIGGFIAAALTVYIILELLDQADGKLAKLLHSETVTGGYFDPFVDSLTHLTAFACLMRIGAVPLWAFLVFLFREFGLLFLRLLASVQGRRLRGRWPGKLKAAVHAVVVVVAMCRAPGAAGPWILAAVIASVLSGAFYLAEYRGVLQRAFSER
jgi:CDP-diacylglycerol---glycerol-3-phosphate 3-phosphatidyltransferase